MKTSLTAVFSLIILTNICFAQWFWQNPLPQGNTLCSVYFTDSNTGWTVGSLGTILKTTDGGVSFIKDNEIIPTGFYLYQNYPNPFNPSTTISFSLKNPEWVILKVYDILGGEVSTLVNEKMNEGSHKINFDGSDLASGIYFYRITAGKFTAVKKLLLVR